MLAQMIGTIIGFSVVGAGLLALAWHHWRMRRTGETIRQTCLLGGLGLGTILGPVGGVGLGWLVNPSNPTDAARGIGMGIALTVMFGAYAFGRIVEKRYDRLPSDEAKDYSDPPG